VILKSYGFLQYTFSRNVWPWNSCDFRQNVSDTADKYRGKPVSRYQHFWTVRLSTSIRALPL